MSKTLWWRISQPTLLTQSHPISLYLLRSTNPSNGEPLFDQSRRQANTRYSLSAFESWWLAQLQSPIQRNWGIRFARPTKSLTCPISLFSIIHSASVCACVAFFICPITTGRSECWASFLYEKYAKYVVSCQLMPLTRPIPPGLLPGEPPVRYPPPPPAPPFR